MAIAPADERNLIFPLFAGLQQTEGWDAFLRRLVTRTGATRICLLQRPTGATSFSDFQREAWSGPNPPSHPLDVDALSACGLLPLHSLRPERVYALEEMRALGNEAAEARQAKVMAREGMRFARFVRFQPAPDTNAWLIAIHDRKDFTATDSALLSSVVPYVALAITTLTQITTLQLRAMIAEEALAMIGVGQVALDREGRAIVADALGARELNVQPGAKPVLRAEVADGLASACAELAAKPSRSRQLVRIDERDGKALLLRPAPRTGEQAPKVAAATALVRRDVRENEASAARVAAACYGLSEREAALAVALSRGESLIEAGDKLRLTRETARNYSKRIYAKTGATGQADLVRMLLTGLVPFA